MATSLPVTRTALGPLVELIRPKDWVKNGLVAAPLVFGGRLLDGEALGRVGIAIVALSLAASAGYVANDLRDVEFDRLHPVKRRRPLASGAVRPGTAAALAVALGGSALLVAATLGPSPLAVVGIYLALALAYTWWIKELVILDVLAIGVFYVLRVEAGAVAAGIPASDWLLIATFLLAVFIGLSKRRHELVLLGSGAGNHRGVLGRYSERFLDPAISLTTSTTLITYLLYAMSPETVGKFGSRGMLAGGPFVLYGLLRYLHLVYSEGRGGSPTDLVITDPGVLAAALGFAIVCGFVVYF
jgi:4-hydroxybenzoate polyprenyltransferase